MAYLKILLIRHAQSIGNVQGVMEGQSSTELSTEGYAQAARLGKYLSQQGLPTHCYSSPLLRATQTAQSLLDQVELNQVDRDDEGGRHSCHLKQTEALQELHQGIFQGLTWSQAQANYPDICAQLMSSLAWQPIPQAESLVAARARARSWVRHVLKQHQLGDVVWAVSHEGFLQQLVSVMMGCDRTWQIRIPHTALFEFWLASTQDHNQWQQLGGDRFNPEFWVLRRFNDCAHLDPQ